MPVAGRTARTAAALVAAVLVLTGCAPTRAAAPEPGGAVRVVASTDVWGDVVRAVGGDGVRVVSLIDNPAQDPHSFEATARAALAVSDADLVVENGGGYDDFMQRLRAASGSRAPVVDAVDVAGRAALLDGALNEHVWYDVPTVAAVAEAVAAALGRLEPARAAAFRAGAAGLVARLAPLERTEAAVAARAAGEGALLTEPVSLHLLRACGLLNRTPARFSEAVEAGTDVPLTVLEDTEALLRRHAVAVLVVNPQTSGPETAAVRAAAQAAGVPVVAMSETLPRGQGYASWMAGNLEALRAALAA